MHEKVAHPNIEKDPRVVSSFEEQNSKCLSSLNNFLDIERDLCSRAMSPNPVEKHGIIHEIARGLISPNLGDIKV